VSLTCQQALPEQTIAADAPTAEKAKMLAPISEPKTNLSNTLIFKPFFIAPNPDATAPLDKGSSLRNTTHNARAGERHAAIQPGADQPAAVGNQLPVSQRFLKR
jgi:hypothetical protein